VSHSGLRQLINSEIGRSLSSHPASASGEDPYDGLARLEFNCWEHSEEELLQFAHSMMQVGFFMPLITLLILGVRI
jgi:hypothetical protein